MSAMRIDAVELRVIALPFRSAFTTSFGSQTEKVTVLTTVRGDGVEGYGLGAQAMAGGTFKAPVFTVAWPTGEFGGMGLEGAVRLGYRRELDAIEDPDERQRLFDEMVARMYEHGKALNTATYFEIDDVIDPAESRRWITAGLAASPAPPPRTGKKRPFVDTW